jgi:hypothetical protein
MPRETFARQLTAAVQATAPSSVVPPPDAV